MRLFFLFLLFFISYSLFAQSSDGIKYWHNKVRSIHYQPEGNDFVCVNGKMRFNRALYGTNTAFRVEAGDLPEFALYMPGLGGNLKFGIIAGEKTKWLIDAAHIKAIYRPGSMLYEIEDPLLGNGTMYISVLALADAEGMIIKTGFKNVNDNTELIWVFGGASGKKFSRDGDIGADPESSFYLQTENCKDNIYKIDKNSFQLLYGTGKILTEEERYEMKQLPENNKPDTDNIKNQKQLNGLFSFSSTLKLADASNQESPTKLYNSTPSSSPVITGKMKIESEETYFLIQNASSPVTKDYSLLKTYFTEAETVRKKIADGIKLSTPDKYINTLGAVLSIAADAIWEPPSYMHGAVAWRMRLNGWRGAYVADVLGWHDRAREHFNSYASSQLTASPVTGVVMDTALHLARHLEKIGTALFSDGYISRNPNDTTHAHHYDMNLVFIDELLNHFNWTGDTTYVKQMWPLLKRHLAWEKRNFDADGDGLYDAYAAIWASDALQYSGGGVTHSSAYNYRANKTAAELAKLISEDPSPYQKEADKILSAINKELWMPQNGWYAEYKDLLGNKLLHTSPGLWTIYHAIDESISDPFQSYQSLRYIDNYLPHIPIRAKGLKDTSLYTVSTTNWQPYDWSLNNVALAELLHTSLAYWQGDRSEEAYKLWKSSLMESMYLGSSPGNIQQLSFYDAIRGELYRDFADPIAMTGRSLVEGLFGIKPDALHNVLTIQPGFPAVWNHARLETPDILVDFKRSSNKDVYIIKQFFKKKLRLKLILPVYKDDIGVITVNNIPVKWKMINDAVGKPLLQMNIGAADQYITEINWKGKNIEAKYFLREVTYGKAFTIAFPNKKLVEVFDPQKVLNKVNFTSNKLIATPGDNLGYKTIFTKLKQGIAEWWEPVDLLVIPVLSAFHLENVNFSYPPNFEKIDLKNYFNDKVTNIFKHQYLSPRPTSPTLQLPTQGIGNWAYPLTIANIDDSGLRKLAASNNEIISSEKIPFATPSDSSLNNILFTSQWDDFPDTATIPLSGKASEIYLLMAGTTNPMQSRITNGVVIVKYSDGTSDTLLLKNPENWWPIEQDYYIDGFAFTGGEEIPERLYLKEGKFSKGLPSYISIKGFTNMGIDGGAATVLNMFLNKNKALRSLIVHAISNDVVIGLMAVTLVR
jgi:hypothetical protein